MSSRLFDMWPRNIWNLLHQHFHQQHLASQPCILTHQPMMTSIRLSTRLMIISKFLNWLSHKTRRLALKSRWFLMKIRATKSWRTSTSEILREDQTVIFTMNSKMKKWTQVSTINTRKLHRFPILKILYRLIKLTPTITHLLLYPRLHLVLPQQHQQQQHTFQALRQQEDLPSRLLLHIFNIPPLNPTQLLQQ